MMLPRELLEQVSVLHGDAYSWAVACCAGDREAGADVLQEAYVKIATGRATFAARSSLKTWWLAVIRFTALERHRGEQRLRRTVEAFWDWVASIGDKSSDSERAESEPVNADQLAAAVAQLPRRQAEVLHLVFQQELSIAEAAAVMEISVGSARQHYERAKKRLRQLLAGELSATICDHVS